MEAKRGFTLIELLIGTAVLGIMGLMIAGIYMAQFGLFSKQSAAIDGATNNTIAIDEIANSIKTSEQVYKCDLQPWTPTYACDSLFLGRNPTYPSATKLILRFWPLDQNLNPFDPAILDCTDGNQLIPATPCIFDLNEYFRTNNKLIKRQYSISKTPAIQHSYLLSCMNNVCYRDKILATNVTNLTFQYFSKDPNGDEQSVILLGDGSDETAKYATITTILVSMTTTSQPVSGPAVETTTTRKVTIRNK